MHLAHLAMSLQLASVKEKGEGLPKKAVSNIGEVLKVENQPRSVLDLPGVGVLAASALEPRGGRSFAETYLDPELADEVLRASKSGGRSKDPFYKFVHAMEKVNAPKIDLPAGIEDRIRNSKELRRSTRLRHSTPTDLSIDPVAPVSGIFSLHHAIAEPGRRHHRDSSYGWYEHLHSRSFGKNLRSTGLSLDD